jgi:hypothetical protein
MSRPSYHVVCRPRLKSPKYRKQTVHRNRQAVDESNYGWQRARDTGDFTNPTFTVTLKRCYWAKLTIIFIYSTTHTPFDQYYLLLNF